MVAVARARSGGPCEILRIEKAEDGRSRYLTFAKSTSLFKPLHLSAGLTAAISIDDSLEMNSEELCIPSDARTIQKTFGAARRKSRLRM